MSTVVEYLAANWYVVAPGVGWFVALVVAPSMRPPTTPYGVYPAVYRCVSIIAGNFGNASNATDPKVK